MKNSKKALIQLDLYPSEETTTKVVHNAIAAKKATFRGGLSTSVHRWFRLTPSFGPELVNEMLQKMGCNGSGVVLDPFSGAGTTLIQCQLRGIESYGFEVNPLLHFVGHTSIEWNINPSTLREGFKDLKESFLQLRDKYTDEDIDNGRLDIPKIHNPFRWWRRDVLLDALILKQAIRQMPSPIQDFYLLGLAGVLVPELTNVTLGRLQLYFIDRSQETIDVWSIYSNHIQNMIDDIDMIHANGLKKTSSIFHVDSTKLSGIKLPKPVDYVVTSPPYPNRYSYVWNTRPHLYFLDFFNNARQATDLDMETIGGTWGSATSVLSKGIVSPKYHVIGTVVEKIAEQIREKENGDLMANYLMKYFNMLADQLIEMNSFLSPDAKIAYVVGCSWLKEVFVETDVLLAHVMEGLGLGYRVSSIERIRKRNSGKDLHESIVYAQKIK